jgi:hypothetical protein
LPSFSPHPFSLFWCDASEELLGHLYDDAWSQSNREVWRLGLKENEHLRQKKEEEDANRKAGRGLQGGRPGLGQGHRLYDDAWSQSNREVYRLGLKEDEYLRQKKDEGMRTGRARSMMRSETRTAFA